MLKMSSGQTTLLVTTHLLGLINMKKLLLLGIIAASLVGTSFGALAASATLDKIKSSGAVTMGVRESSIPMSYTIGDSRFDGYHVEVCRMILNDIKAKLGMSTLRINYQPVTSQNRVPLVQNGTVDIECGTTTNNSSLSANSGSFISTRLRPETPVVIAEFAICVTSSSASRNSCSAGSLS